MKDGMAQVKAMFKTKGVKNGYDVYHSGFGSEESYYMISLFGGDKAATFFNVIKLTTKHDQVEASFRPDLSYYPSKKE